jgi:hypothetical protein
MRRPEEDNDGNWKYRALRRALFIAFYITLFAYAIALGMSGQF